MLYFGCVVFAEWATIQRRQKGKRRLKPSEWGMRSGTFGRIGSALCLLALAACGGIQVAPAPPIANFEDYLIGLQNAYPSGYVIQCLGTPLADPQARICRDRIVQTLMVAIDLRYQQFELGFFDANRQWDFGTNLAVIGLGTAGAFVSGGTSQILSGAVAAVAGTREAFTKTMLAEQTSVALLNAMRTQRDQVGLRIRLGLRQDAPRYPLGAALADVSAYYRAGSIVGALTGVTQAVGIERGQAQEDLQEAIVNPEFGTVPPPAPPPLPAPPPTPRPTHTGPPPPPPIPGHGRRVEGPPPQGAEITEPEFLKLREVFGLTERNAPLRSRERAPAFRTAVKVFHHCKNPAIPEVQQSGALTLEEKPIALANTDPCLAKIRESRGARPGATANPSSPSSSSGAAVQPGATDSASQPPPSGAAAPPGATNPVSGPLSPGAR
jgi:hypothetical protein